MIVGPAEDASALDGHLALAQLAPCHAFDRGAEVDRREQRYRDARRHFDGFRRGRLLEASDLTMKRPFPLDGNGIFA